MHPGLSPLGCHLQPYYRSLQTLGLGCLRPNNKQRGSSHQEASTSLLTSTTRRQSERIRTTIPSASKINTTITERYPKWKETVMSQMKEQDSSVTVSDQLLCPVWIFATPRNTATRLPCTSPTSGTFLKLMSSELTMQSNHLILHRPLLQLPSILPSVRVFSNESVSLHQVAKVLEFQLQHQSFKGYSGLISFRMAGCIALQYKGLSRVSPTPQFKSINSLALSLPYDPALTSVQWPLQNP